MSLFPSTLQLSHMKLPFAPLPQCPLPASYPMGNRGSFPRSKAAGAWSWRLISIQCRGQECV